jgi:hypothetical protein
MRTDVFSRIARNHIAQRRMRALFFLASFKGRITCFLLTSGFQENLSIIWIIENYGMCPLALPWPQTSIEFSSQKDPP